MSEGGRMRSGRWLLRFAMVVVTLGATWRACFAEPVVPLPEGVRAVWDLSKAHRERTPTRERVCLNGLWRWQPAEAKVEGAAVPAGEWGFFKTPGAWPGVTDYLQKDSQTLFAHP